MEIKNETQMVVADSEGKEHLVQILFTYENEERGHSYVFVYLEGEEDDVMPFIYNEEDKSLTEIEDEEEFDEIEEVFNAFVDEKLIKLKIGHFK